jgi:hypothetical protein
MRYLHYAPHHDDAAIVGRAFGMDRDGDMSSGRLDR